MGDYLKTNYAFLIAPALIMTALMGFVPSAICWRSGVQYSVGDSLWTIPPYPYYFSNWSSSHFFNIGDSLVFDFETGRYDVIQVTRLDYELCTSWNPIKIFYGGPAIILLTEPGVFYFICNFSNYCDLGMRIAVHVDRHKPYPPLPSPSPSPSPSPASAITPSPQNPKSHVPMRPRGPDSGEKSAATTMTKRIYTNIFGVGIGFVSLGLFTMVF